MVVKLAAYLEELASLPLEKPLEPDLKPHRQALDAKLREEHDLSSGAVLQAIVAEGDGSDSPGEGDLVYIHYSIRSEDGDLLFSTRSDEGGSGSALGLQVETGRRGPRAWEVALKGMGKGARRVLKVKPSYGYSHPDCKLQPPAVGISRNVPLTFDLQLVSWYPAGQVQALGVEHEILKRALVEGSGFESPRPPFEVSLHIELRLPSYDGVQQSGRPYFTTLGVAPLSLQMGTGALPQGVEDALGYMSKGESALFLLPTASMVPPTNPSQQQQQQQTSADLATSPPPPIQSAPSSQGASQAPNTESGSSAAAVSAADGVSGAAGSGCLVPAPPGRSAQVEVFLQLLSLVQVRDLLGGGEAMKKRLVDGQGEFPIDCPLHDTTVRIHYRARALLPGGGYGPWVIDTAAPDPNNPRQHPPGPPPPDASTSSEAASSVEFDTGCGEMPLGLEAAVKLMIPGEMALVTCAASHSYADQPEHAPPGIGIQDRVQFELQLVSFQKEGYWQTLEMAERLLLAERIKGKAAQLYRTKRFTAAASRYERLLRMLESTRDFDTQEEIDAIDALKLAVLGNLALCCFGLEQYAEATVWCTKALEHDPDSAKLTLRRARALSFKGDHSAAEDDFTRALELSDDKGEGSLKGEIEREIGLHKARVKAASAKQKSQFKDFWAR